MRLHIIYMLHVLAWYTCLADYEHCSDCEVDFTCCKGTCRPCFNCQMYLRHGGSCACSFNDCGPCLNGYEEVSRTKFSSTVKACRIIRSAGNDTVKCTDDESCPIGKYCFGNMCTPCFDCKLYHREPSRFTCAKHPSDCGKCMKEYFEAPVTHHSKFKSCIYRTDFRYKLLPEQEFLYVIIIVIVGGGIFAVFLRRNRNEAVPSSVSRVERPFSDNSANSLPVSGEEETIFTYVREEREKCNAAAFVESSCESVHLPALDEEVLNTPNTPINNDDEETIPSSWTPNASVETRGNIEASSFTGIINRIRETKLTEPGEECVLSGSLTCTADGNEEMAEIETATQEIRNEEDTKS